MKKEVFRDHLMMHLHRLVNGNRLHTVVKLLEGEHMLVLTPGKAMRSGVDRFCFHDGSNVLSAFFSVSYVTKRKQKHTVLGSRQ